MSRVAVASSSAFSADAGARVGRLGGNAVDAAIASSLVSMVTEPGIVSLGGGGFVAVWPPDGPPVVIDGYVEMPGRGVSPDRIGGGVRHVHIGYGGGVDTTVGHGSVGTPGTVAALGLAADRYGRLPWKELVEPAWEHAARGFPLPQASYDYLKYSHERIFGWCQGSYEAIHTPEGELRKVGETIVVPGLADSLRTIAEQGPDTFYEGEIARIIVHDSAENGGLLTAEDLHAYRALIREPLEVEIQEWRIATNPPPALGGAALAAMLLLMERAPPGTGRLENLEGLIQVQGAVLDYRRRRMEQSDDIEAEVSGLLRAAAEGDLESLTRAPSTVHTSTVDENGLACAITVSFGYGSGVVPPGTGIVMNNCLGEIELNPRGLHAWSPGTRLPSNMAPSVGRRSDGAVLAIGSPGASRITTAILQVLARFLYAGMPLPDAVAAPRLHVEHARGAMRVAYEEGLDVGALPHPSRHFDEHSMYFGGVGAALWDPKLGFTLAADPRRQGGTAISG
jgi:gamma-glutamyltranspeptidase/glutathione hydrolase